MFDKAILLMFYENQVGRNAIYLWNKRKTRQMPANALSPPGFYASLLWTVPKKYREHMSYGDVGKEAREWARLSTPWNAQCREPS